MEWRNYSPLEENPSLYKSHYKFIESSWFSHTQPCTANVYVYYKSVTFNFDAEANTMLA